MNMHEDRQFTRDMFIQMPPELYQCNGCYDHRFESEDLFFSDKRVFVPDSLELAIAEGYYCMSCWKDIHGERPYEGTQISLHEAMRHFDHVNNFLENGISGMIEITVKIPNE